MDDTNSPCKWEEDGVVGFGCCPSSPTVASPGGGCLSLKWPWWPRLPRSSVMSQPQLSTSKLHNPVNISFLPRDSGLPDQTGELIASTGGSWLWPSPRHYMTQTHTIDWMNPSTTEPCDRGHTVTYRSKITLNDSNTIHRTQIIHTHNRRIRQLK